MLLLNDAFLLLESLKLIHVQYSFFHEYLKNQISSILISVIISFDINSNQSLAGNRDLLFDRRVGIDNSREGSLIAIEHLR